MSVFIEQTEKKPEEDQEVVTSNQERSIRTIEIYIKK